LQFGISNIISISCGDSFCVCVCKNGVFSWGDNSNGELGIENYINQSSPQQISFFKNPEEIISMCCGKSHSVCVSKNGVFSWGDNNYGELGIGNNSHQSSPQQISFFKNPEEIISLSCGYSFCVCLCKNGVYSWGCNIYGELGIGNFKYHRYIPQPISFFQNPEEIISLSCGDSFCVCLCKNGIFSWGYNKYGQLGIGNFNDQSSPQQILFFKNPEDIISVCCGYNFCICVCENEVFSWGSNNHGQLGIGNQIIQSSPQQILFFQNPEEIISLSCGQQFSICICKNRVLCWGNSNSISSYNGQLGIEVYKSDIPKPITFKEEIESFFDISFFRSSSFDSIRYIRKLILILAREYLDPDECLVGKYYLPRDMFNVLLKLI